MWLPECITDSSSSEKARDSTLSLRLLHGLSGQTREPSLHFLGSCGSLLWFLLVVDGLSREIAFNCWTSRSF